MHVRPVSRELLIMTTQASGNPTFTAGLCRLSCTYRKRSTQFTAVIPQMPTRGAETNSDELVTSKEATDSTFPCHEDKETASQMDAERRKGKKHAR